MKIINPKACFNPTGRLVAISVFVAIFGMPTVAIAQQKVPPSAALQSCSVNNAPCHLDSYAGWFVGPDESAKIVKFEAASTKPSVTTESRLAADGVTQVVTFRGANGKYLAVQPNNNWQVNFVEDSADLPTTQFVVVDALESPPDQKFSSFKTLLYPDRFLRHQGYKLFAHPNAETSLFRRDASWRVLNAATINTPAVLNAKPGQQAKSAKPGQQKKAVRYTASHGDVHITTPDGLIYDFQERGDFLLTHSTDGSVKLQSRQARWDSHPERPVSVNTAIALYVDGDKLEFYVKPERGFYVNGVLTDLPKRHFPLPAGGYIDLSGTGRATDYTIMWPNGDTGARVILYGDYIDTGIARLGGSLTYEGVLGNLDGNRNNDIQVRGGDVITPPASLEQLKVFGNSWRLSAQESLFKDAVTTEDKAANAEPLTLNKIDPAEKATAATVCNAAGVTDPLALHNCTYDVAVTGDKSFVESAKTFQTETADLPAAHLMPAVPEQGLPAGNKASAMANKQSLNREQFVSMNGDRLQVNPDGNLCLFAETGPNPHRWCVNDEIGGKYAEIQRVAFEGGVLSAYDSKNMKLWSSKPVRDPSARLTITPEGRLVILSGSGAVHWQNK